MLISTRKVECSNKWVVYGVRRRLLSKKVGGAMGQVDSLEVARRLLVIIVGGGRAGACAETEAQGLKPCRGLRKWIGIVE